VAEREDADYIELIWHGGEPLMLTPDWYEQAHQIADEVYGEGKYFSSVQSSMIPYSNKWNELVHKRWDSFIGSSMDFSSRAVRGSVESYAKLWMKRVNQARESGIMVIPSFVPSKNEIGKSEEIIDWFVSNEFPKFNFERYTNFTDKNDINYPSNKEHSEFMINLFDGLMSRMESTGKAPDVKPIYAAIKGVKYGISGDRWGTSCQSSFIIIEPNGDINTCPDRANSEKPFTNLKNGVDSFLESKGRRKWISQSLVKHKGKHCLGCEYSSWCQSGCPIVPNTPSNPNVAECSGYKYFLDHVKEYLASDKGDIAIKYISDEHESN
ncbi:SPASM domain-containing protein, partial [Vibrio splendidus]